MKGQTIDNKEKKKRCFSNVYILTLKGNFSKIIKYINMGYQKI